MVNRIAIQNDFPHAAWSCGTIAILTILHLTLGKIRPDNINTDNINRRHILAFHLALLQRLILSTPPNLWNLNCINKNIIRFEPTQYSVAHAQCGFMQSLSLPIGINTIPRHYHTHNTPSPPEHVNLNPAPKLATPPAIPVAAREKTKPPTIPHNKNPITHITEPTPPTFTKPAKHYPILTRQDRQKRISAARRRGTRRDTLHHATNQHPLSDYWPDIIP